MVNLPDSEYKKVLLLSRQFEAQTIKFSLLAYLDLPNGVIGTLDNRIEELEIEIKALENKSE